VSYATLDNLDEPSPSILTLAGDAVLATGPNYSVQYVPPVYSGSTAAYFGEPASDTPYETSQYVAAWGDGSATLSFSTPQNYFGLLWGSVGPGDCLTFYDSENNVIGEVFGSEIPGAPYDYVNSSPDCSPYVNITSTTPFSSVVATTTTPSFEFDDVAYADVVPEPANTVLFSTGLFILGFVLRRKSA
jgi:hypothetical protein